VAKLNDDESRDLERLERPGFRLPPEQRAVRTRLRFKRDLPPELWDRMVAAKRAQIAAIQERETIEAELRQIAPDDDEADLLWWIGEQVVEAASAEVSP
jgi:hypothetical protein